MGKYILRMMLPVRQLRIPRGLCTEQESPQPRGTLQQHGSSSLSHISFNVFISVATPALRVTLGKYVLQVSEGVGGNNRSLATT